MLIQTSKEIRSGKIRGSKIKKMADGEYITRIIHEL